MIPEEQYEAAVRAEKEARGVIEEYHREKSNVFKERWAEMEAGKRFFTDDELRYAAWARCEACNAGLAYPKGCGGFHMWSCSAVLKGEETDRSKHVDYPFSFYSIRSEEEVRANGQTTRPK